MAIPDNDNRIQLPPTIVDFDNVVGITGQAHDTFPAAGQQPRYDWMRLFLIGLLSLQSSNEPPTQYRVGTPWFNREKSVIYVWDGSAWVSLASFIAVSEDSSGVVTLLQKLAEIDEKVSTIQPRFTYSGVALGTTTDIPIPDEVGTALGDNPADLRPLVYINGALVDPRKSNFVAGCPSKIELSGGAQLTENDTFTVIIERFDVFVQDNVIA